MYAVIRTGGKQARVQEGDFLDVERLRGAEGETIELSEVLLVGDDPVRIGTPLVEGARVVARIAGETKGPKLRIFKYKRRKRYRLRQGHRQRYTRVVIESIEVSEMSHKKGQGSTRTGRDSRGQRPRGRVENPKPQLLPQF